jgi:hypothetical protein
MEFNYSINIRELRIDGVFIKNFNCDTHFKIYDQIKFVQEIVKEIRIRI